MATRVAAKKPGVVLRACARYGAIRCLHEFDDASVKGFSLLVTFRGALLAKLVSPAMQHALSHTNVICELRLSASAKRSHQVHGVPLELFWELLGSVGHDSDSWGLLAALGVRESDQRQTSLWRNEPW